MANLVAMEQRFWNKVRRRGDDECWEWTGHISKGYGIFHVGSRTNRQRFMSHRVAWELTHGEIPEGLIVRHKCRGKCCNPAHLELGTHAENNADMVRDGTSARGIRNPSNVLTEAQARCIKQRLAEYTRGLCVVLAKEYGVSYRTIHAIMNGENWAWLD